MSLMQSKRFFQVGFTLIELLVVVVILGLLIGYAGPKYFSQVGKSKVTSARAQISAFSKAADQYRLDVGHYPTTEQGLAALIAKPASESKWEGPYLEKTIRQDPWDRPYQYKNPGEHGDYDLFSLGKDGAVGGTGENVDITSW